MAVAQGPFTADNWPIATCLHAFPPVDKNGIAMHDASDEVWDDMFTQVADAGFTLAELADSHVRPADLEPSRRDEFLSIAKSHGVGIPSVSTNSMRIGSVIACAVTSLCITLPPQVSRV